MLISALLGLSAMAMTLDQRDPTQAPRDAFSRCLFAFADAQVQERKPLAEFEAALPQQCQNEERAFREAIRAQLTSLRVPAAQIEEDTTMEVDDARANTKGRFEDAITPR